MTLKQLLDSLTFDEIAPCILNRYKNYDVRGLLALYKQHFDYLRSLVPTDPDLIERKRGADFFIQRRREYSFGCISFGR